MSTTIQDLISELESIINKIRVVRFGDLILPEDHNYQTDAIKKIRDIFKMIYINGEPVEPDFSTYQVQWYKTIDVNVNYTISEIWGQQAGFLAEKYLVVWYNIADQDYYTHVHIYFLDFNGNILKSHEIVYSVRLTTLGLPYNKGATVRDKYVIIPLDIWDKRYYVIYKYYEPLVTVDNRDLPTADPSLVVPSLSLYGTYHAITTAEKLSSNSFRIHIRLFKAT